MSRNAAGLDVRGAGNPRWKGGRLDKICCICSKPYQAPRTNAASRFCSLQCVGVSQRGRRTNVKTDKQVEISCETCGTVFVKTISHAHKYKCCSLACSYKRRSTITKGERNPNWAGGASRLPYTWDFKYISRKIIERDGRRCQNPGCAGRDRRLTTHHINYDKQDNSAANLICLCSACNSSANYDRAHWTVFYVKLLCAGPRGLGQ